MNVLKKDELNKIIRESIEKMIEGDEFDELENNQDIAKYDKIVESFIDDNIISGNDDFYKFMFDYLHETIMPDLYDDLDLGEYLTNPGTVDEQEENSLVELLSRKIFWLSLIKTAQKELEGL